MLGGQNPFLCNGAQCSSNYYVEGASFGTLSEELSIAVFRPQVSGEWTALSTFQICDHNDISTSSGRETFQLLLMHPSFQLGIRV